MLTEPSRKRGYYLSRRGEAVCAMAMIVIAMGVAAFIGLVARGLWVLL